MPPIEPLEDFLENATWARLVEFIALTLVSWIALSILGVIRSRITFGPNGVGAERLADLDARGADALLEVRNANLRLAEKVARLEGIIEALLDQGRVSRSTDHRSREDHGSPPHKPHSHRRDEPEPMT
jgi:hypothetical protein